MRAYHHHHLLTASIQPSPCFHETLLLMSYHFYYLTTLLNSIYKNVNLKMNETCSKWQFQNGWFPTSQLLVCVKLTITFLLLTKLISEWWTLCTKNLSWWNCFYNYNNTMCCAFYGNHLRRCKFMHDTTATFLHKCGCALLNENWAITAAHCVEK